MSKWLGYTVELFFNGQSILVTLKNPSYLLYHGKL